MHKNKLLVISFVAILLVIPVLLKAAPEANQVVYGNYYQYGEVVKIVTPVESDVLVAGGTVEVVAPVGGDILVLGGNVRILAPVSGNVRVIAGNVEIMGNVAHNVLILGGKVIISSQSRVFGHVTTATSELELAGTVEGSVRGWGNKVKISGTIQGPVDLWLDRGGDLEITANAKVNNQLNYQASREAIIAAGAKVADIKFTKFDYSRPWSASHFWFNWMVSLFGVLVLSMVIVSLWPKKLQDIASEAITKPLASLGWGALWAIAVPLLVILLLFTVVGVLVSVSLALIYVLGLLISHTLTGWSLIWYLRNQPKLIWLKKWSPLALMLAGVTIYHLLLAIPWVGWLIGIVGALLSWGAWLRVQKQTIKIFN